MKLAVICAIYNEEILLPQFLDYYSPKADEVFLLDNESTDKSRQIAQLYPNVVVSTYKSEGKFSDVRLSEAYAQKRRDCVGKYDYVLIADCDEFVLPKQGPSICGAIEKAQPPFESGLRLEFMWTDGWEMWPRPGAPPYDPRRTLPEQLRTGIQSGMYSKPCIIHAASTLKHDHGRHDFEGLHHLKPKDMSSARFYLLHYVGFDKSKFVKRGLDRAARFADINRKLRTSVQYRDKTEADFLAAFEARQNSEHLVEVPFSCEGVQASMARRRLEVGLRRSPRPRWDTLDVGPNLRPTYRFDVTSPDWPIEDGFYDEILISGVFEYLSTQESNIVLRRFFRILKSSGVLRVHVSPKGVAGAPSIVLGSEIYKTAHTADGLKKILSGAGLLNVEDVSPNYESDEDVRSGKTVTLKLRGRKGAP